jgi:hypothetical protein
MKPDARSVVALVLWMVVWALAMVWPLVRPDGELIFRDIPRMVLPNFALIEQAGREGVLPLLDPRKGGGMPFLHDPQSGAWYPLSWVFSRLGVETGFRAFQWFHVFWLGLGCSALGLSLSGSRFGAALAGTTAIGAFPHLLALEWMHMIAGLAWVPWILVAAAGQRSVLAIIGFVLLFSSGHAYLWVAVPVLGAAALVVCPAVGRRRLVFALGLLPLLTWPFWGGYLDLSGLMISHGFAADRPPPVVGFAPVHFLGWLLPEAFRSFRQLNADGTARIISQFEPFAWTRACYVGILPLLLCALSFLGQRDPSRQIAGFLIGAGVFLAAVFPLAAPLFPAVFRPMFHPASFIGLAVFGVIFLTATGYRELRSALSQTPDRLKTAMNRLMIGAGVGMLVMLILGGIAGSGGLSPVWGYRRDLSWVPFLLTLGYAGLVRLFAARTEMRRFSWILPFLLLSLHLGDLAWNGQGKVPASAPSAGAFPSALRDLPPGEDRIYASDDLIITLKQASGAVPNRLIPVLFQFLRSTGVPNFPLRDGIPHLGAYNPPFFHHGVQKWLGLLENLPAQDRDLFLLLSNVRYVIGLEEYPAGNGWKCVGQTQFPDGPLVKVWDLGPSFVGCILTPEGSAKLPAGRSPGEMTTLTGEQRQRFPGKWVYHLPDRPAGADRLFLPWAPLPGWRVAVDGTPVSLPARGEFGLEIRLPPGGKRLELWYEEPRLARRVAGALLGVVLLALLLRKLRAGD